MRCVVCDAVAQMRGHQVHESFWEAHGRSFSGRRAHGLLLLPLFSRSQHPSLIFLSSQLSFSSSTQPTPRFPMNNFQGYLLSVCSHVRSSSTLAWQLSTTCLAKNVCSLSSLCHLLGSEQQGWCDR
eukprot:3606645-Rhodomonas_salina.1